MYYVYGIERLIQLSTESAFGIFSIIGGLILLGTSVARAIVTRKKPLEGENPWGNTNTVPCFCRKSLD
jgi:hypothetical protein